MQFTLDYFYGTEAGPSRFYRMPKALFDGALSLEAATLYGLMLDRVGLSVKNGWTDGLGRVFIYFVQKDVQKFLRCGRPPPSCGSWSAPGSSSASARA